MRMRKDVFHLRNSHRAGKHKWGCFLKSPFGCSERVWSHQLPCSEVHVFISLPGLSGKAQSTKILKHLFFGKKPQIHWKKMLNRKCLTTATSQDIRRILHWLLPLLGEVGCAQLENEMAPEVLTNPPPKS